MAPERLPRPLGANQRAVLRCLAEHGDFHPGCGWLWDNYGGTVRILESLVRRGLVTAHLLNRLGPDGKPAHRYELSAAGDVTKGIGNAVPPPLASAVITATANAIT